MFAGKGFTMNKNLPYNYIRVITILHTYILYTLNLKVEERAAEFYSMLILKEVFSKHSGAYTCTASNSAARTNFTAILTVKGIHGKKGPWSY